MNRIEELSYHIPSLNKNFKYKKSPKRHRKKLDINTPFQKLFEIICNKLYHTSEIIKCILANPKYISQVEKNGNTLLHIACKSGNLKLCRFLISRNNNNLYTRTNIIGNYPIHRAVYNGNLDIVKYIKSVKTLLLTIITINFANIAFTIGNIIIH